MDLMNRGSRTETSAQHPGGAGVAPHSPKSSKLKGKFGLDKIAQVGFLAAVAILVLAVLFSVVLNKNESKEASYVDEGKLQAVFLNGGQVYFGKISDLNSKYLKISNIYYLRVNQQVQPNQQNTNASQNDISLVKLGCELHGPQDDMVVNREQVIFWENLKTDGQVAKAVDEYVKQNPDGQKCEQQAQPSSSNTNTTNTNTNSTTNNTANPTTNTNNTRR
jgi:hypothetical protein